MKLWDKGTHINEMIEKFTVGNDRELDLLLAPYDVLGSLAHVTMLGSVGLLDKAELPELQKALKEIYSDIQQGNFQIEAGVEDVHSQVEMLLTRKVGAAGKKIHSARSRNDQVLVDIKLFARAKILEITGGIEDLFQTLILKSEEHKDLLMPGYTHLQVAMPSSFGLWFGAYAESLADDLQVMLAAYRVNNQNPLGSAAGYGSSFPIDREMTTRLLGFESLNYNVVYAQMGRGKVERIVAQALGNVAATLARMAWDVCLFMSQNFGFLSLPEELTTGSSIMPHKKNPDVFELIRAKCNKIQSLANEMIMISNNLPSGYFRDMQILKESYLVAFDNLMDSINIATFAIQNLQVNQDLLDDEKYKYVFSVEEVNKLVLKGVPFRDAYREVGEKIRQNEFSPGKKVTHSHTGSIGNLCNTEIRQKFTEVLKAFRADAVRKAESDLLN